MGFGPDAASDFGGRRFTAVRDVHAYIEGILSGGMVLREVQDVPMRDRAGEYLMMRLRTTAGLDAEEYERSYLLPFAPLEEALERFRSQNLAVRTYDGRWHLTPQGFLLSNSIISDLLIIQEHSESITKRR